MHTFKLYGVLAVLLSVLLQTVLSIPKWYESGDGTRFFIEYKEEYTWYDAFYECADRNLKLVAFESEEKHNALKEVLIANFQKVNNLWIGGYDNFGIRKDRFRPFYWINKDQVVGPRFTYTNWAYRQPDNYKQREHCVHIWGHTENFEWNDNSCHRQEFGYVCEERQDSKAEKLGNAQNDKDNNNQSEVTNEESIKQIDSDTDKNKVSDDTQIVKSIYVEYSDDLPTDESKEKELSQVIVNVPANNDWKKSLENIQLKTETDVLKILFNQRNSFEQVIKEKK